MRFTSTLRGMLAGSLMLGGAAIAGPAVFADDDDDFEPEAYLYEGTCDALASASVTDEIADLDNDDDDAAQLWERYLGNGVAMPEGILIEEDDVDDLESAQALVDGDYVIVVHETEDTDSAVIACGDIEGTIEDDSLLLQLNEVDGSGYEGRAFIHPDDDDRADDDDLEFVVGVFPAGSVEPVGSPAAAN